MAKLKYQHHCSSLQGHTILQNHSNMFIWCSRHFLLLSILKTVNCLIFFCGNVILFFIFFMNSKLKTTAFIWNRNLLLYYECLLMSLLIILMPSWLKKAPKLLNVSVRLLSHCYMELYSIASWKNNELHSSNIFLFPSYILLRNPIHFIESVCSDRVPVGTFL